MRLWLAGAVVWLMATLAAGCASGGSVASLTPSPTAAPTTIPKQEATPAPTRAAGSVLSETIEKLDQAQSYQFEVSAVLMSMFEGRLRGWEYKGAGAFARPDKIQWTLQGQSDVHLRVASSGGNIYCEDSRGANTRDCSLAFGGPRPGSSPFTVLAYLKNAVQNQDVDERSVEGVIYDHFAFSPSLQKVSSLDSGHLRALSAVKSVTGEVLIDKSTKLPFQERVTVTLPSPTGDETVQVILSFSKFNEPVEIRLPR